MNVLVAQKGSREHFLAARALHQAGHLAALVADWYAPRSPFLHALAGMLPFPALVRLMAARCDALPDTHVHAFRAHGFRSRLKELSAQKQGDAYSAFLETDAAFAKRVAAADLPGFDTYFGFSYASLEAMAAFKTRGTLLLLDQIDPGPPEARLVHEERERWPDYALPAAQPPEAYYARLRQEWALADAIIVNSDWTRELIMTEGVPGDKIEVLPLAYDPPAAPVRQAHDGPLRVLWLGTVNIRKGIQYLVEAAKTLDPARFEITVAGRVDVAPAAIASAPDNIKWLGPVPRSDTPALYQAADVFVLPTLSDGFALTQLEALSQGLPLIITPNCARIVSDRETGRVIPAGDAGALAEALQWSADHRAALADMAEACVARSQSFSHDAYVTGLLDIIRRRQFMKSGGAQA